MDPTSPTGLPGVEGGSRAPLVLGAAAVVALLAIGVAVLVLTGGGDDEVADDEAATVTTEVADEDAADEPDRDGDGVPDASDPDDDDDGVPDREDTDDDGDGIPDEDEPGDEGDGGGGVDAPDDPGDPDPDPGDPGDPDDPGDPGDPGDEEEPSSVDLLRVDPRPAVDAWIEAAGEGAEAIEVVLRADHGVADIRDPDDPDRVLAFGWRDGTVQGPEPIEPRPGTDLDAVSFRMTAVDWDALPRLVADAPERAGLPAGEVTHVIVRSDLPFSSRFLFRIYVTAPDGREYVVATIDGRPADR